MPPRLRKFNLCNFSAGRPVKRIIRVYISNQETWSYQLALQHAQDIIIRRVRMNQFPAN